jgi:hypothetical protein
VSAAPIYADRRTDVTKQIGAFRDDRKVLKMQLKLSELPYNFEII